MNTFHVTKIVSCFILTCLLTSFTNAQSIVWTDVVNATVNGNSLTSTSNANWNAGAASLAVLPAGIDGYIEIEAAQTNNGVMFGFSEVNTNQSWNTIDYNLYVAESGKLKVYEKNIAKVSNGGVYAVGDKMRVERVGTTIYFKHNGNVIYTSTTPSTSSLIVDCSFYQANAILSNAIFNFGTTTAAAATITTNGDDDWAGAGTGEMYLTHTNDNVGIGTTTPDYKLHVKGSTYVENGWMRFSGQSGIHSQTYGITMYAISSYYWRLKSNRGLQMYNKANQKQFAVYHDNAGSFGFLDKDDNWTIRTKHDDYTAFSLNNSEKMRLSTTGELVIGATTFPALTTAGGSDYLLYVNGGVLAKEVKIETGWADYVFDPTYTLASLEEVATHITEKGCLPNTPSAQEIENNGGINVGSTTVKQQEKIEELFLYLIELNERIKTLEKENTQLKQALQNNK